MTQLNRRSMLTGVAAVPAAVALIAIPALGNAGDDAELLRIGQAALDYALSMRGQNRKRVAAYNKTVAISEKHPHLVARRVSAGKDGWVAHVETFEDYKKFEDGSPSRLLRLKAQTYEEASRECAVIDKRLFAKKCERFERFSEATGYHARADEFTRNHTILRKQMAAVARLRAHTHEGIAIKAKVVTVANAVMDETWYTETLQASLMRDLARMDRAA